MLKLLLGYEWREWVNIENGEVKKYRVFYAEHEGLRIPVKPADYTSQQILNQIIDNLEKGGLNE